MDLTVNTFTHDEAYFIANAGVDIATGIKIAGAAIPAHAPVVLDSSGKLQLLTAPSGSDPLSTTGLYGITADECAANKEAVVYLSGEFFKDGLVLPTGITADMVEIALRELGIFLK